MKGVVEMRMAGERQAPQWAKRYRLFLWMLLLTVLLLAGCIWYCLQSRSEIPKEGTLVRSVEIYERKA